MRFFLPQIDITCFVPHFPGKEIYMYTIIVPSLLFEETKNESWKADTGPR